MFDFSFEGGGLTIYWPGGSGSGYPPGTTLPPGSYYPQNTTQISTGMLVVIGVLAYLAFRK